MSPRILIIDDDVQIRVILRQMLERSGYEVEGAHGAKVTMRLHQKELTDLSSTGLIIQEKVYLETIMELQRGFLQV